MSIEKHPFEPFLPQGARILFLGSFPPQEKRWCMPFFYPNWINDFWRIMGLIHFGDKDHFCIRGEKRFDEAAIRAFCTKEGLAFYDTACAVRRLRDGECSSTGANSPGISSRSVTGEALRTLRFWRMPSTSRAYPFPLRQKAELYRQLF